MEKSIAAQEARAVGSKINITSHITLKHANIVYDFIIYEPVPFIDEDNDAHHVERFAIYVNNIQKMGGIGRQWVSNGENTD